MSYLEQIVKGVIEGDIQGMAELTTAALNEGTEPKKILDEGLLAGMAVVGQRFKTDEMFIPEVLMSAQAVDEGMKVLEPILAQSPQKIRATVAIGTVKGDIHDIGKNLVVMMFKGAGFEVIDLGVDAPAEKFIEVVKSGDVKLLGMSALLTTTAPYMGIVIKALEESGIRDKVKVMVGGAVVTDELSRQLGADAYAPDAIAAAEKARVMLG